MARSDNEMWAEIRVRKTMLGNRTILVGLDGLRRDSQIHPDPAHDLDLFLFGRLRMQVRPAPIGPARESDQERTFSEAQRRRGLAEIQICRSPDPLDVSPHRNEIQIE